MFDFLQDPLNFWIIVAILCFIVELVTVNFYTGLYSLSALFAIWALKLGQSFMVQFIIFIGLANLLYLIIYKFKDYLKISSKTIEKTNIDYIIGKEVKVIEKLNWLDAGYMVSFSGQKWSAISYNGEELILEGKAIVIGVDGVKLVVKPIK